MSAATATPAAAFSPRMSGVLPDRTIASHPEVIESASAREIVKRTCGGELAARIDDISDISVQRVDVDDDMLVGVLRVADEVGAQLIAVPNRGDPGPVRVFLPNLAAPLLVASRWSMLVVPDEPQTQVR